MVTSYTTWCTDYLKPDRSLPTLTPPGDSAPPTPSPRGKWMRQYSLSSHRGSIDIVKTVVVLTDFQIVRFSTTGVESWNRDMAVKGGRVLAFDGANAGHQRKSTRVEGVGAFIFTTLSFPPFDRPCGKSASGGGHGSHFEKAAGRGPVEHSPPPSKTHRFALSPDNNRSCHGTVVAGDPVNLEVHFLHSDNPRHGFQVMSVNPLTYYDFQTPIGFRETHTIVTNDSGATVVTFNWFGSSALGTMTWPGPPTREPIWVTSSCPSVDAKVSETPPKKDRMHSTPLPVFAPPHFQILVMLGIPALPVPPYATAAPARSSAWARINKGVFFGGAASHRVITIYTPLMSLTYASGYFASIIHQRRIPW
ncbi:hypothetical protein BJV77DRAFT_1127540 [Russula vinacea]|nr:hypothetical protein BJV77DRAFT_1127540 [Russula vinacea]